MSRDALLRAVLDNPPEDTVRLAFADFLDENGEPERAEFVRLQVEFAARQGKHGCPQCKRQAVRDRVYNMAAPGSQCRPCATLDRRVRELILNFPAAPYWDIPPTLTETHPHRGYARDAYTPVIYCHGGGVREFRCRFERGFVAAVICEANDWLRHGPHLLRRHPVEWVVLSDLRVWKEEGNEQYGWWDDASRATASNDHDEGYVPTTLFDEMWELFPSSRREDEFGRWMIWGTFGAAHKALGDGCVSWALDAAQEVGL